MGILDNEKIEIKEEKPQKQKDFETTIDNYTLTNWIPSGNGYISRKPTKTES